MELDPDYSNYTTDLNETLDGRNNGPTSFEVKIAILIGITFSITIIVGIIGNSLVFLTILLQKQMRSTTNILILNLAIAELLFILLCVPFTGFNYVSRYWYFGDLCCRVYQYMSNVTCYVIILLLVFMSLDRYLAIHVIGGTSIRNQRNAIIAVTFLWIFILLVNIPHLFLWEEHSYVALNENRTVCILKYNIIKSNQGLINNSDVLESANFKIKSYYSIFFFFGYFLPFMSIVIIYGLIMLKLRNARGQQVSKSKRRVTFMVIAVVLSFVLCWGPLQIMLFLQHVFNFDLDETLVIILVISNCIAYLNTCINPIIYGFANQDFRAAYAAILRCEFNKKTYTAVGTQISKHELSRLALSNTTNTQSTNKQQHRKISNGRTHI